MTGPEFQSPAKLILLSTSSMPKISGKPPSTDELAQLLDGKLPYKRKEEIFAYLNRDPALFNQWMRLVDAQADQQKSSSTQSDLPGFTDHIANWFGAFINSKTAIATTSFALLVVVGGVYLNGLMNIDQFKLNDFPTFAGNGSAATKKPLDSSLNEIALNISTKCSNGTLSDEDIVTIIATLRDIEKAYLQTSNTAPKMLTKVLADDHQLSTLCEFASSVLN